MAAIPATAGPLGQRKVFSFTPRLTDKAIVPISHYLTNESCPEIDYDNLDECQLNYQKTAESAFLTGIALCRLWELGLAGSIPSRLYDMNFMSGDVAPMECVKNFLSTKGFDEPFDVLLDRSLRNGTITLDEPPVAGLYRIENLSETDFRRLFPNVDPDRPYVNKIEEWTVTDRNQEIGEAIFEHMDNSAFDWDLIVWSLAKQLSQYNREDYNYDINPRKGKIRSTYLYNNLDQAVIDLFRQGGFSTYQAYHRIVTA